MDVESRVRRVLQERADTIQPDTPEALSEVRGLARRRTAHRRAAAAAASVLAVAAAVAVVASARSTPHRTEPAPSPDEPRVTLSIVSERSAEDLGIEQALNVAVGAHGHVYVTDTSQHVTELTPDLRPVRTWGGNGTGPGKFRLIQGSIAVGPHGRVYVSDAGNFRVQEFTRQGRFVGQVGSFGTGPGQFTWPFDVAVDQYGDLYVADDRAQTLAKLTPSGRQIWRHGGVGAETDPRLLGHEHLAGFDPSGHLLSVNDDAGLVLLWNAAGEVVGGFGTRMPSAPHTTEGVRGSETFPRGACDVSADSSGHIYITSCDDPQDPHWNGVFSADGTLIGSRSDSPLATSPRWALDGRGYTVTSSGGVAEVVATSR